MAQYEVRFSRRAERQLLKLPESSFERLTAAIKQLADEPRPRSSKKLGGRDPLWRLRVGSYRVKYTIMDADHLIGIDSVERRTSTTYKDKS